MHGNADAEPNHSQIANPEAKRQSRTPSRRAFTRVREVHLRGSTRSYSVVTTRGEGEAQTLQRSGMSHVDAMILAEELRRDGAVVVVMHVVDDKSYEVDRYPAR